MLLLRIDDIVSGTKKATGEASGPSGEPQPPMVTE